MLNAVRQGAKLLKRRFTLPNEMFALELNSAKISIYACQVHRNTGRGGAAALWVHGVYGSPPPLPRPVWYKENIYLEKAVAEVNEYPGNIWTHIISLKREDSSRLGFDHARQWRNLLLTYRNDIAAAMHIPPKDFRWYAAFHDEGDHPHVHMMAWSAKPGQAYLSRDSIRTIKETYCAERDRAIATLNSTVRRFRSVLDTQAERCACFVDEESAALMQAYVLAQLALLHLMKE